MKPKLETFSKAVMDYNGNLSKVAAAFKVSRGTVYLWLQDEEFKAEVDAARDRLYDKCLATAEILANGIPDIQDGKMVGWLERPDGSMLRYLMGARGKRDGFGENIDVTTNGKELNSLFRVLTKEELEKADEQFDKDF